MKTKMVKEKGYYKLIVDDKEINKKYNCENNPIVLGCITEFFDGGQWRVEDYRLKKYLRPSPYLEDSVQQYLPEDDEGHAFLRENLHTYEFDEESGAYYWPKFDSTLFEGGDLPCLTDKTITQYSNVARFTFKTAFKLLQKQKEFWTNYDKDDLTSDEVRIDNPHRQMSDSDIFSHFFMKEMKAKEEAQKKKLKP